jgi:nicotinate-nucleotide adenylyltransferase
VTDPRGGGAQPVAPAAVVPGRLGVLGGTFDPIHIAHLAIAEEAREVLGLERVLFIPAGDPWQKAGRVVGSAADRLAMVALAIAGNPAFACSRLEIDRAGPTYTVDTMAELDAAERSQGREPDLWFILSSEALRGLATWREPDRLLSLCRLAVVPRDSVGPAGTSFDPGWLESALPGRPERVVGLGGPRLGLSASEIRARVAVGRSIRYLVPDAVAAYIGDHGLYMDHDRRNDVP